MKATWSKWLQIDYYDNKNAAPFLQSGTPPYYPDSSQPHHVASFVYNPNNDFTQLLFRADVPKGNLDAATAEARELVNLSDVMADLQEESNIARQMVVTETAPTPPQQIGRTPTLDQQRSARVSSILEKQEADEEARFRIWTSANGKFTTEAKILSLANGVVTLEDRKGKKIKVPQDKLIQADRDAIQQWRNERR